MIEEFEVIPKEKWVKEVTEGIKNAEYIAKKINEAQPEKQVDYNESNGGVWNTIKNYIVEKVMKWDGIEMIEDEDINLKGYAALLATYEQIGDRCVPIRYHNAEGSLGLQIMDNPERKEEFIAQHRYEQMKNFV